MNKEFLYQIKLKAPVVETDACFRLNNGMLKKNSEGFYEVVEDNKELRHTFYNYCQMQKKEYNRK